ncbi:hypothetical protein EXW96_25675 [Paenibacillus sp. JMULE4]|nr:hypothetical protein [Cohnella algarum]NTZ20782.1 hypothetical protein [Paenibacillus sp. JMULE4]
MNYLEVVNERLKQKGLHGELCLFGGAVMCLVFHSREVTKDIDAVFAPTSEMYTIIKNIADEYNLEPDWLNPAVKGYVSRNHDVRLFKRMSNLAIYAATAEYMFAMKCLAARGFESKDREDIQFLARYLGIRTMNEALAVLEKFYPQNRMPPRSQYVLEELFGNGL